MAERTLPTASLAHHIAGRTRLRLDRHKREGEILARLADALESAEPIDAVAVSRVTGSVLVIHRLSGPEELGELGRDLELFDLRPPASRPVLSQRLGERVQERLTRAERWVERESRGEVDLPGMAFVLLIFAGFYQALQGRALPAGVTLFRYALGMMPFRIGGDGGQG